MIHEERLLKILCGPHISEKSSIAMENKDTVVLKVLKDATKIEIARAIKKIFEVEVKDVNTLILKGKTKIHGRKFLGFRSDWKKAYITLKKGQTLDLVSSIE